MAANGATISTASVVHINSGVDTCKGWLLEHNSCVATNVEPQHEQKNVNIINN